MSNYVISLSDELDAGLFSIEVMNRFRIWQTKNLFEDPYYNPQEPSRLDQEFKNDVEEKNNDNSNNSDKNCNDFELQLSSLHARETFCDYQTELVPRHSFFLEIEQEYQKMVQKTLQKKNQKPSCTTCAMYYSLPNRHEYVWRCMRNNEHYSLINKRISSQYNKKASAGIVASVLIDRYFDLQRWSTHDFAAIVRPSYIEYKLDGIVTIKILADQIIACLGSKIMMARAACRVV